MKWSDKEWLREHYVQRGLTTYKCGALAGCSKTTIANWLRHHGLPVRNDRPAKVKVTCANCGMQEERQPSHVEHRKQTFCSRECMHQFLAPKWRGKARHCGECGRAFQPTHATNRFCSSACWNKYQTKIGQGYVTGTCYYCGAHITKPARTIRSEHIFCDWDCYANYRREADILIGRDHPMYRGGFDWEQHAWLRTDEAREWRATVIARDHGKCKLCGSAERLTVHHIKSFRESPGLRADPDNGVVLCRTCHGRVHFAPDADEERAALAEAI